MCVFGGVYHGFTHLLSPRRDFLSQDRILGSNRTVTLVSLPLFLFILHVALSDLLSPMTTHSMLQRHFLRKYILFFALHSNELMNFRFESCWSALRSHPFLAHHQPHTHSHSFLFVLVYWFLLWQRNSTCRVASPRLATHVTHRRRRRSRRRSL